MKVVAYCRVSTDSRDQANSFENQKSYFEREIAKNPNYELVQIYADKGISGTKLQRPEFDKMLYDAGLDVRKGFNDDNDQRKEYTKYYISPSTTRQPKYNLILTKNTSRFARNTNVSEILDDLKKNGVYVYFLDLNKTTQNESDITFIKIFQVFDENDSRDKSIKVKFGQQEGVRHGVIHVSGKIFGYNYIKAENRLEIIPEEAEIIKTIFNLYSNGLGIRQIINTLTDSNITTRQGKPFCKSSIRRILTNEKYAGYNNPFKYDTGVVFNKNSYPRINEEYDVVKSDKIPEIISIEIFNKCKDIMQSKVNYKNQKGLYNGKSKYCSLIYCGKCGSVYYSNQENGRTFYNCSNKKLHGTIVCNNPNINETVIDQYISNLANGEMSELFNETKDTSLKRIYKEILVQYQRINKDCSDESKNILLQIQELKNKLDKYIEIFAMGELSQTIVQEKIKTTEVQINDLKKTYAIVSESNVSIANRILSLYNTIEKITKYEINTVYTNTEIVNMIHKIIVYRNGNSLAFSIQIKPLEDVYNLVNELDSIWEDEIFDENEINNIISICHDIVS